MAQNTEDLSCKFARVGVVLIAKNEEENIYNTLSSLRTQTLEPCNIVLVNDSSTDRTRNIVEFHFPNVQIVDYLEQHENWTTKPDLAKIFNLGFKELAPLDLDYVLVLGSDHILPCDYLERLVKQMQNNSNIVIASGSIKGEYAIVPRGSGRLIDVNFFKGLGFCYPVKYGHEGYFLYKAQQLGHEVFYDETLETITQRQSAQYYDKERFRCYGRALKAFGYSKMYFFFVVLTQIKKGRAIAYIQGYMDPDVELYEKELRDFVKQKQQNKFTHLESSSIKHFISMLRKGR